MLTWQGTLFLVASLEIQITRITIWPMEVGSNNPFIKGFLIVACILWNCYHQFLLSPIVVSDVSITGSADAKIVKLLIKIPVLADDSDFCYPRYLKNYDLYSLVSLTRVEVVCDRVALINVLWKIETKSVGCSCFLRVRKSFTCTQIFSYTEWVTKKILDILWLTLIWS